MSDKLRRDRLVGQLAARLRDQDSLPSEAELSAELGVGRQQIREALGVLEAFGAVTSRQGARRQWVGMDLGSLIPASAQLAGASNQTLAELLDVRQALETSLLAKVMPLHTTQSRSRILAIAAEMEQRAEAGLSFTDLDRQFHVGLFEPLKNHTLQAILDAFWGLLEQVEGSRKQVEGDREVAAMHAAIITEMEAGDIDLARYELDTHFYGVRRRIIPSRLSVAR
ncbi:MAG: FadR/GntR family transcriptional regulator [Arachnia sp.]